MTPIFLSIENVCMGYVTIHAHGNADGAGGGGDRHRHQFSVTHIPRVKRTKRIYTESPIRKFFTENFYPYADIYCKKNLGVYVSANGMTVLLTTNNADEAGDGVGNIYFITAVIRGLRYW